MYIRRSAETLLDRYSKIFKVILVTGARQTGKTTLIKKYYPDIKIVDFDDEFLVDQATNDPGMFLSLNKPPVFLDEVQYVPSLFRFIKKECDESEEKALYFLSGSQPLKLMEKASDSLAGRVGIIELQNLSLREITNSKYDKPFYPSLDLINKRFGDDHDIKDIWSIIYKGFYPALQDKSITPQDFFPNYVKTYLERDVRTLSAVHDLRKFRTFMVACAVRTGQILNVSNIASEVGIDQKTASNWLSILEASDIIYLLEPYTSNALNRAIKAPKLYFRDTGLCAYLARWLTPETLAAGALSGNFFETFVVSEILKTFSNAGYDHRYYVSYYRGKDKTRKNKNGDVIDIESEIDLIIEFDNTLYPIEIKSSPSPKYPTAFNVLDKIKDKKRGLGAVICTAPQPTRLNDECLVIPYHFI